MFNRIIVIGLILVLFSVNAFAASHYVRPNGGSYGAEDGTDWDNAFDGMPSTMIRGDTYYVAGGSYPAPGWYLNDAESGTDVITIKKANAADCSGVTGWSVSFASDQVVVSDSGDTTYGAAIIFTRGYYTIDGVTGAGAGSTQYGIKVKYGNTGQRTDLMLFRDNSISNIIIKYVEFEHQGSSYDYSQSSISSISGSLATLTVQHCYAHDFQVFTKNDSGDDFIIEYSYFQNNWSSGSNHGELLSIVCRDDMIFRYNIVDNATNGTGGIIVLGDYTTYSCDVDNVQIYGNLFFDASSVGNGLWGSGNSSDPCGITNWKIYNNTIVDQDGDFYAGGAGNERDSGCVVKNNLFYNANADIQSSEGDSFDNDYNYYNGCSNQPSGGEAGANDVTSSQTSAQTFTAYASDDYTLVSGSEAIDDGMDASAILTEDMNGVSMPQNEVYDIGAYEFINNIKLKGIQIQ